MQEEKDRIESEEREHIAFHITVPTAISEGFMHSPIHLNKHYLDNPMRQAVEEIKDSIHEAYKYGDIGEAHRDQLLSNLKPWQHEALCREFELEEKAERNWHDESDPTNGNECDWDLDGSEYRWAQEIRMKEQNPDLNHGLVDLRTIEVNDGPNGEAVDGYGNLLD